MLASIVAADAVLAAVLSPGGRRSLAKIGKVIRPYWHSGCTRRPPPKSQCAYTIRITGICTTSIGGKDIDGCLYRQSHSGVPSVDSPRTGETGPIRVDATELP